MADVAARGPRLHWRLITNRELAQVVPVAWRAPIEAGATVGLSRHRLEIFEGGFGELSGEEIVR